MDNTDSYDLPSDSASDENEAEYMERMQSLVQDHLRAAQDHQQPTVSQYATTSTTHKTAPNYTPQQVSVTNIEWHQRRTSKVVETPRRDLPAPPSMRTGLVDNTTTTTTSVEAEQEQAEQDDDREVVAVFNANSPEGNSMVRALAAQGCKVVAIVRVFTSKNTRALVKLKNVTVKVADSHSQTELTIALVGVHRAILCTKYWELFASQLEELQAHMVLQACAKNHVPHLVFSSFEDTQLLKQQSKKSQLVPDKTGKIHPQFRGMREIQKEAKKAHVQLTHMLTSYLDQAQSKKSLCLIVGENGKLLVQDNSE